MKTKQQNKNIQVETLNKKVLMGTIVLILFFLCLGIIFPMEITPKQSNIIPAMTYEEVMKQYEKKVKSFS
jgi:hypothetical protein